MLQKQIHTIEPLYDGHSRYLILGSFPSQKSRESGFFYGHPRNRFWKVMSALLGVPTPETIREKRTMLLQGGIALWDVIGSCRIEGSSDSSIRDVVPNDLEPIFLTSPIERVFTNGGTAHKLYARYQQERTGIADFPLPSTSPANARFSEEMLIEIWKQALRI